jgi:hypothetical protein
MRGAADRLAVTVRKQWGNTLAGNRILIRRKLLLVKLEILD